MRAQMGMVFQSFNLFSHRTILDNVTMGPIEVLGTPRKEAERQAMELLEKNLWGRLQHTVCELYNRLYRIVFNSLH